MKDKENLSKLEKLKLRRLALDETIKKKEQQEKTKNRKQETRKKILVGSYYLEQVEKDGKIEELKKAMDRFLTRKNDREIFGLKEI
jgi:hypothetical protein